MLVERYNDPYRYRFCYNRKIKWISSDHPKGYDVKAITHGFHTDHKLVKIEKDALDETFQTKTHL